MSVGRVCDTLQFVASAVMFSHVYWGFGLLRAVLGELFACPSYVGWYILGG